MYNIILYTVKVGASKAVVRNGYAEINSHHHGFRVCQNTKRYPYSTALILGNYMICRYINNQ